MPITIPGMGACLEAWRAATGSDRVHWATELLGRDVWAVARLQAIGDVRGDAEPRLLAKALRDMEERDLWPYSDHPGDVLAFAIACRQLLITNDPPAGPAADPWPDPRYAPADRVVYHVARHICDGLGVVIESPPYPLALTLRDFAAERP